MKNKMLIALPVFGIALALISATVFSQGTGNQAADKPQVVAVKLSEWSMGMMDTTVKGSAEFEVSNEGKYPHLFTIEGKIGGKSIKVSSSLLKAGEKTALTISLPAGTYFVYCPIPGHADQGMKGTLTFQ